MNHGDWAGYRVEGVLGEGGMGTVYRALHLRLGRAVALKVLDLERFAPPMREELRARFVLEASLAARLSHPNIVTIYDFGAIDERRSFIAMELIEGKTLEAELASHGALPATDAIRIAIEAARALRAAHASGVVHRDLKPGNLMLHGEERTVKLVDFGLVREVNAPRLTQQGAFLGTLGYLAPETFTGGVVDQRSDLYALGVVLFECLTGAPPFPGALPAQVMNQVVTQRAPTLAERAPQLQFSSPLEALVARLLSKDPTQRPRDAEAVLEVLASLPEHAERQATVVEAFRAGAALDGTLRAGEHVSTGATVLLQLLPALDAPELEAIVRRATEWNGLKHRAAPKAIGLEQLSIEGERRLALVYDTAAARPLPAVLHDEAMTSAFAISLALQLFELVAAAHAQNVVHGCLGPNAVTVDDDGLIAVRGPSGLALDPAAPWVDPEHDGWGASTDDDVYAAAMIVLTSLDPLNPRLESTAIAPLARALAPCLAERERRPRARTVLEALRALGRPQAPTSLASAVRSLVSAWTSPNSSELSWAS